MSLAASAAMTDERLGRPGRREGQRADDLAPGDDLWVQAGLRARDASTCTNGGYPGQGSGGAVAGIRMRARLARYDGVIN